MAEGDGEPFRHFPVGRKDMSEPLLELHQALFGPGESSVDLVEPGLLLRRVEQQFVLGEAAIDKTADQTFAHRRIQRISDQTRRANVTHVDRAFC